jgi:putative glutamine amidotransferase
LQRAVISQTNGFFDSRNEFRDSLDSRLGDWVLEVGLLPFPVPNHLHRKEKLLEWLDFVSPSAVILSGGGDIGNSQARDETEKILLQFAEANELPLLGLCRGMQMLGLHFGSSLVQVDEHVKVFHDLLFEPEQLFPNTVNSYHRFALSNIVTPLRVVATSPDGVVEAIKHIERPWEGWMWHPEREMPFHEDSLKRASRLLGGLNK